MAGRTSMIIIMLFFLIFYLNTVPVVAGNSTTSTTPSVTTSSNTTQFDNFTIEWEDFSLFTCAVPITINISLFTCFPPTTYGYVDDMTCLNETILDFDQTTCQASTTGAYTTSYPITTQQMTTVTTATTKIQILTSAASATAQSTTKTPIASTTSHGSAIAGTTAFTSVNTIAVTTHTSINTTAVTTHTSTAAITNSTSTASNVTTHASTTTNTNNSSVITTTTINGYGNVSTTTTINGYNNVNTTATTIGSTTTTTANIYNCYPGGYIGTYCNISSDACAMSQPCLNAATCFPNNTLPYGYLCQCQTGYAGYNCQYDERPCMENTCWNNGTCISVNTTIAANNGSDFRCECVEGYDGVYCELKIDLCGNITCENKGMCVTAELMWKCICLDSTLYYGAYCQYKTGKLKLREILSKSFASIAIGAIITTCTFIVIMDILKYAFHIDPVEGERESYRKRLEDRRRARQPVRNYEPKLALRFQYVS